MYPKDTILSENSDFCKNSLGETTDNCTVRPYMKFSDYANEAVKIENFRDSLFTYPNSLSKMAFSPKDANNPLVRGHECKHDAASRLMDNVIFCYAQLYCRLYPNASTNEIAEQLDLWYRTEGKIFKEKIDMMEKRLDCIERDFNLGKSCYPMDRAINEFLRDNLEKIKRSVRKRARKR